MRNTSTKPHSAELQLSPILRNGSQTRLTKPAYQKYFQRRLCKELTFEKGTPLFKPSIRKGADHERLN